MKTKFWNLSIYRIIATLCVLTFHIFYLLLARDVPYEMLLSKGVQGLTAMSGFLYSQKLIEKKGEFYLKNLKKLLIPAFIVAVCIAIGNLVVMIANNSWDINYFSLFVSNRPYDGRLLTQLDNYYYIAYIIGCYLVTPFIQKDNNTSRIIMLSLCLVEIVLAFCFRQALIVCAYMIGYAVGRKYFGKYTDYKQFDFITIVEWILVIALSAGCYVLSIYLRGIENQTWFITESISLLNNISSCAIGIGSFFLLSSALVFVNKFIKKSFILTYGDKICYNVYLLNQMFMVGGTSVLNMTDNFGVQALLVFGLTIATAVVVYCIEFLILDGRKDKKEA